MTHILTPNHSSPPENVYGGDIHPMVDILVGDLGSCLATEPIIMKNYIVSVAWSPSFEASEFIGRSETGLANGDSIT